MDAGLFLVRDEKFLAFAEDAVNGLGRAGIQAEPAGFHAPGGIEFIRRS